MRYLLFVLFSFGAQAIEVASLHPLLTDMVKQVGGERVSVVEVGKPGMSVHEFEPRPSDLRKMGKVKLIFASGKKIETYLGDLEDSLNGGQIIVEVGRTIPSQKISKKDQIYACCPTHAMGGIDPHWWHNVRHMERAVRVIEKKLTAADPEGKGHYAARAKAAAARLRALDGWVKAQVATIPRGKRHLVTAHAAFGYFCKAYGFKATYVQGLNADGEVPAKQLATSIKDVRDAEIPTIFPEMLSNPKILKQIARETGSTLGKPIVADGAVASYEKMIRGNVSHIVNGLRK
ncbi:MAG: metal ABC transporter substrate-binding protein [Akkermansiaceae bacterium]